MCDWPVEGERYDFRFERRITDGERRAEDGGGRSHHRSELHGQEKQQVIREGLHSYIIR